MAGARVAGPPARFLLGARRHPTVFLGGARTARADAQTALRLDPDNKEARALLARIAKIQ